MIKFVTSAERHTSNQEWMHSEFSFSFADYDDPSNAHFGSLLAHNDNELKPGQGMHRHPHHDLEIITYVVSGVLRHEDNLGNKADLQAGTIQKMSAGTGIRHSETNPSESETVRFLQLWVLPSQPGLTPEWDAKHFPKEHRMNKLLPVASGMGVEGTVAINEDATVCLSVLETGKEVAYRQSDGRRTHLFLISGDIEVTSSGESFKLGAGDALRIRQDCDLIIKGIGSEGEAELILVDLP